MDENGVIVDANCLSCNKAMRVVTDGSTDVVCPDCEDKWDNEDCYEPYVPYREKWGINWQDSTWPNEY